MCLQEKDIKGAKENLKDVQGIAEELGDPQGAINRGSKAFHFWDGSMSYNIYIYIHTIIFTHVISKAFERRSVAFSDAMAHQRGTIAR